MDIILSRPRINVDWRRIAFVAILTILAIALAWAHYSFLPESIDWVRSYRPATLELLSGRSPYNIPSFFNPPWILIPLAPIAVLPPKTGDAVLFVVTLISLVYTATKMGAKPVSLVAFLVSFPVVFLLLFGQIDWLILLGILMPPQIGLLFVLAKPQIGIGIAAFWLVEAWREGGIREVVRTFWMAGIVFALSLLIFGLWPLRTDPEILTAKYNFSLWPWSILPGLVFLAWGIFKRDRGKAILSGPMFSPYVAPHSWSIALASILKRPRLVIVVSLLSWLMLLIGIHRP